LEKDRLLSDREIHDRDLQWIMESDLVVAEVTVPSLGVGYEIGRAVHLGKPALCLFSAASEQPLSAMIAGCSEVELVRYKQIDELHDRIKKFVLAQHT
jgi:nucleoside 2-deoxyribosyltransferase